MARPLVLTITESSEELQRRLQHETNARQQERLQMLYWLKQGLVHSCPQIAQLLHCNESSITRWLNAYRQGGLQQLLAVKTPPEPHPPNSDGTVAGTPTRPQRV
ncbi:helix-turn-helix domain-containing protein [Thermosynechococcus sp. PKX82]|uniref:helix-turn-helix domain-containing protein n=1 Tax=Thermosynechococcus sp. PKX82 TaxID=3074086 RepID=UPI002873CE47|nr:helix-turn-helix domain-containing protein [Thermosynechococcus sp. PKX82]WNC30688.1 helix-turn-helix domain-containing protein [Thermosynechococcus sp. PKX82]